MMKTWCWAKPCETKTTWNWAFPAMTEMTLIWAGNVLISKADGKR